MLFRSVLVVGFCVVVGGVIKINQAIPGYIGNKTMKDLTGIANIEDEE